MSKKNDTITTHLLSHLESENSLLKWQKILNLPQLSVGTHRKPVNITNFIQTNDINTNYSSFKKDYILSNFIALFDYFFNCNFMASVNLLTPFFISLSRRSRKTVSLRIDGISTSPSRTGNIIFSGFSIRFAIKVFSNQSI